MRQWETVGDKGRQGETRGDQYRHIGEKADTPIQGTGTYVGGHETVGDSGRQWETSGRQGETRGDKGRQDPREGGHTIQYRHICGDTVGDSGRQGETRGDKTLEKADTPSNTGTYVGKQLESGDSGRQGETRGDKGDKTLEKADTPSNTGTYVGIQWERRGDKTEGWETRQGDKGRQLGDKGRQDPPGRRTHHPIQAHMWWDSERQWETVGDKGRQGETGETRGDKTGKKADTPSNTGTYVVGDRGDNGRQVGDKGRQGETRGDKTLEKADTPSNTGTYVGRQWETGETRPSGRRTQHPIQAHG